MDDVKKAFLSLSRKVHPDKNPEHIDLATRAFQRLQVLKAAIEDALVQPWAQPTPTADHTLPTRVWIFGLVVRVVE